MLIRWAAVGFILGQFLLALAVTMLLPIGWGLVFGGGGLEALVWSALVTAACGGSLLAALPRPKRELKQREALAVVVLAWFVAGAFGALPFLWSGYFRSVTDAVFESASGFTTTGATILTSIETVPESLLFWRSLTHWLGGMGIIVLSLAILPMLGVGGMQLFKAEVPGPTADRLKPRIQDTAKLLWGVYVILTGIETALLMFGGMNFYEALCHSFATLATGGFSTRDASVAAYDSAYIEWVITFFMFAAGVNFSLHYQALRGRLREYFRNEEFLFYLTITLGATIGLILLNQGTVYDSLADNLRYSAFQASSILTTTGFGTADYEQWPVMAQYMLVFLMFVGGCAGSTGGGMKVARILLLFKHAHVQVFRLIHPRAVRLVKLGATPVKGEVMQSILGFFALFMGIFVVASMLLAATGMDLVSSGAAVIATLSNIGPGLGSVGPIDNYSHIPAFGKGVLIVCMLMGRLELFTVLVLFIPSFWRR